MRINKEAKKIERQKKRSTARKMHAVRYDDTVDDKHNTHKMSKKLRNSKFNQSSGLRCNGENLKLKK